MTASAFRRTQRLGAAIAAGLLATAGLVAIGSPAAADDDVTVTNQVDFIAELALAEATPDPDIIRIDASGTWNYNGTLTVNNPLQIIGPGSGDLELHSNDQVGITTGATTVSLSGLTITSGAGGWDGIRADLTALTLDDIDVSGSTLSGIDLDGGSLVATNIVANDTNSVGITGIDVTSFQLTDAVANGNGARGVMVETSAPDAVVSLLRVSADANEIWGLTTEIDGGTITVTDCTATNTVTGVGIFASVDGGLATVTGSTATGNVTGIWLAAFGGGVVNASGLTADSNGTTGLDLWAGLGGITVTDSTARFNGASAPAMLGGGVTIEATDGRVTVDGLNASNNQAQTGGGIGVTEVSGGSDVVVQNSTVNDNLATDGAGIYVDLLSDDDSSVEILDSTVAGNSSVGIGGVYFATAGVAGEGEVRILVARTTIDGNEATIGAGLVVASLYGGSADAPLLTIDSSTISNNTSNTAGVVAQGASGAGSWARMINSTISGNTGGPLGGIYATRTGESAFTFEVLHSTITGNGSGGDAGGIGADAVEVIVSHTILSDNDGGDFASVDDGNFVIDWSISTDPVDPAAVAALAAGTGNRVGIDPQLGPLADNDGPTLTHILLPGGPAIDTGDAAIVGAPAFAQRGEDRIRNGRIDIGAVEVLPTLPATGGTVSWWLLYVAGGLLLAGAVVFVVRRVVSRRSTAS